MLQESRRRRASFSLTAHREKAGDQRLSNGDSIPLAKQQVTRRPGCSRPLTIWMLAAGHPRSEASAGFAAGGGEARPS